MPPEEDNIEDQDQVVVVSINIDGREIDFILSDVLDIDEKKYAVLYSDDEFLLPEDRTLFATITEEQGEDKFTLVTDPIEANMVAGYVAVDAIDEMLVSVRSELREIIFLLGSLDPVELPLDKQKVLSIIQDKVTELLKDLNEEAAGPERED